MSDRRVARILEDVAQGQLAPADAQGRLEALLVHDLGFANVDHARPLVQGFPEVVFGEGKAPEHVVAICESLVAASGSFLVTRVGVGAARALVERFEGAEWNEIARTVVLAAPETGSVRTRGSVLVISAGTSDEPVAQEAAVSAAALGNPVDRLADVGVAGIHRLLKHADAVREAAVVIVVAGMDGALASVVGGMVGVPVIAVPTSVGYGAAFGGVSALLAMLNSCASGVTVVNIDGGFTAAAAATRINRLPA